MKTIKSSVKRLITACLVLVAVMMVSSCGSKSNSYDVEYIAVQFEKGQNWSIIDADGKVVVSEEYSKDATISKIVDGAFWVKDRNGYQLFSVDDPKKPLIDDYFKSATVFANGYAFASKDGTSIKVIDTKGKEVKTLPATITQVDEINEGYARYYDANLKCVGLLDEDGDVVLEAKYVFLTAVKDGACLSLEKGQKELKVIDPKGEVLGTINHKKYTKLADSYSEGLIYALPEGSESNEAVFLNKKGEKVMTIKNSDLERVRIVNSSNIGHRFQPYFCQNGYIVYNNESGKYGVADKDGEMVIRPKYDAAYSFLDKGFMVNKGQKWGIINAEDKEVLDFDYDEIAGITLGGNYIVKKDGLYSVIDQEKNRIGKDEFYAVSCDLCDNQVYAVTQDLIVSFVTSCLSADSYDGIKGNEKPKQIADMYYEDDPSDYVGDKSIGKTERINKNIKVGQRSYFLSSVSERQDEDKCVWTDAIMEGVLVDCEIDDTELDKKELLTAVVNAIKQKGFTADAEYDMQLDYDMKGKGGIANVIVLNRYKNNFALVILFKKSDAPSDDADGHDEEEEFQPDDAPANQGANTSLPDYSWLSIRLATESDLAGMNNNQLRLMRNYIFARHGYIFSDQALTQHFSQYPWYKPTSKDVLGKFNSYEKKNVAIIKAHE